MKVIVGLGNVGREYVGTRHNIGFDVVDLVETKLSRSSGWKAGRGDYYLAKGFWRDEEIILVKPTTFMNLSGRAVVQVLQFFKAEISDLLIICDDIAIPLGALRLRLRGSDGGHNGLKSIIYDLATSEFPRLRCGVGGDFRKGQQVSYVLGKFGPGEIKLATELIERTAAGCLTCSEVGFEKAMNTVNYSPIKEGEKEAPKEAL